MELALKPDKWWVIAERLKAFSNPLLSNKRSCYVSTVWFWQNNLFPLRQHGTTDLKVSPLTQAFLIFHPPNETVIIQKRNGNLCRLRHSLISSLLLSSFRSPLLSCLMLFVFFIKLLPFSVCTRLICPGRTPPACFWNSFHCLSLTPEGSDTMNAA